MADALDLDQVALNAGHHGPDVAEGDAGEQEAPEQGQGHTQQCRQQAVAPVLGDGESGVAHLPHTVEAVGALGLCDHVFKIYLQEPEGDSQLTVYVGFSSVHIPASDTLGGKPERRFSS